MKYMRLELDDDKHKDFKLICVMKGINMKSVCIDAIEKFVNENRGLLNEKRGN